MIERWREIQRSNEESESRGGEIGTANIPTGFNESDIRKKIDKIQKDIGTISTQIREHEDNARSLENQSKILDQRASLIESMQKGKL